MAKETLYFSHDCNARNDRKIVNLRMQHGMQGVGVYWCIVEMLYEEGGYLPLEYERITFELRIDENVLQSVIHAFDLFEIDGERFHSPAVLERLTMRMEKSEKARKSISCRWQKNGDTNVLRSNTKRNTKKEKEKEKEKEKSVLQKGLVVSAKKPTTEYPEWLPVKTFHMYLESRKKKLNPVAFPKVFENLKKLAEESNTTPENILDQSIANGWEGLFPLKNGFVAVSSSNTTEYDRKVASLKVKQSMERTDGASRVSSEQGNQLQGSVGATSF